MKRVKISKSGAIFGVSGWSLYLRTTTVTTPSHLVMIFILVADVNV